MSLTADADLLNEKRYWRNGWEGINIAKNRSGILEFV